MPRRGPVAVGTRSSVLVLVCSSRRVPAAGTPPGGLLGAFRLRAWRCGSRECRLPSVAHTASPECLSQDRLRMMLDGLVSSALRAASPPESMASDPRPQFPTAPVSPVGSLGRPSSCLIRSPQARVDSPLGRRLPQLPALGDRSTWNTWIPSRSPSSACC